jgi:ribonuclease HII
MILGIDEAGRGPWAGPLVVGAVVLGDVAIDGLTDSKKLTKKRREILEIIIKEQALGYGLGWVSANELDEVGMSEALRLATRRAVEQVKVPYHEIIIDGTVNFLASTAKGKYVTTLAKADMLIASVSAASVLAKVARDRYMTEQSEIYPEYGFNGHAGYGVARHREAIEKYGVTPLHRLSFAPLQKYASTASGKIASSQQTQKRRFTTTARSLSSAKLANAQTFSTSQERVVVANGLSRIVAYKPRIDETYR